MQQYNVSDDNYIYIDRHLCIALKRKYVVYTKMDIVSADNLPKPHIREKLNVCES